MKSRPFWIESWYETRARVEMLDCMKTSSRLSKKCVCSNGDKGADMGDVCRVVGINRIDTVPKSSMHMIAMRCVVRSWCVVAIVEGLFCVGLVDG